MDLLSIEDLMALANQRASPSRARLDSHSQSVSFSTEYGPFTLRPTGSTEDGMISYAPRNSATPWLLQDPHTGRFETTNGRSISCPNALRPVDGLGRISRRNEDEIRTGASSQPSRSSRVGEQNHVSSSGSPYLNRKRVSGAANKQITHVDLPQYINPRSMWLIPPSIPHHVEPVLCQFPGLATYFSKPPAPENTLLRRCTTRKSSPFIKPSGARIYLAPPRRLVEAPGFHPQLAGQIKSTINSMSHRPAPPVTNITRIKSGRLFPRTIVSTTTTGSNPFEQARPVNADPRKSLRPEGPLIANHGISLPTNNAPSLSPRHNLPNPKDHDVETTEQFNQRLTFLFQQMMFVSGETAEPSAETTWMIEEIVREQVLEMLTQATILANRRGSRSISIVDLIFQIRHDRAKVSRLKTFLSWKDVRKNVKDSDDKGGGDAGDVGDFEEAGGAVNPSAPQKTSANKKAKLMLPWEIQSFFNEQVPERDDEEDEDEEEQNEATLARLASADERTKNMTKDEYVYWSDCRQASFTFRKGKRFREWAGFGTIIDSKPNDDVVDILGFLTFEIVQTLTEEALKVKAAEDLANKKANVISGDQEASKKRKREGCSLFEMPEEGRTPVEPKHVREGFRRLQQVPNKYKFMRPGYAGMRTPLRMI